MRNADVGERNSGVRYEKGKRYRGLSGAAAKAGGEGLELEAAQRPENLEKPPPQLKLKP